jgi:hypothetical protein
MKAGISSKSLDPPESLEKSLLDKISRIFAVSGEMVSQLENPVFIFSDQLHKSLYLAAAGPLD